MTKSCQHATEAEIGLKMRVMLAGAHVPRMNKRLNNVNGRLGNGLQGQQRQRLNHTRHDLS